MPTKQVTFISSIFLALATLLLTSGCATQSHRAIEGDKVETYRSNYSGPKTTLFVGKFDNRSNYMQGLFSSNTNRLGSQAKTILKTHLQQTNRFKVVDRENMEEIAHEAKLIGMKQQLKGARYAVTGAVSEFGRKEVGDHQLFGILGSGKKQIAYAKVTLNVVDVTSSEIIYSTQGAGEYQLSNREIVGFGSTASYDATLNGKVLNFAVTQAVDNMVLDLDNKIFSVAVESR